MAWPTGWEGSYDMDWGGKMAAGSNSANRENLMDPVVILDPTDTPLLNMLPKEEWPAPYVEWMTDIINATNTGGAAEGGEWAPGINDAADGASVTGARTRYKNNTQIMKIQFAASRTAIQTSQRGFTAGVRNEYQYHLFRSMKALMRNIDARISANGALCAGQTGNSTGTGSSARLTTVLRGFGSIVTGNVNSTFATGSYANIRGLMDAAGADPDTMFVTSQTKVNISAGILAGTMVYGAASTIAGNAGLLRRFNADAYEKEVSSIIDVMEDDFGRVVLIRDRWMPNAAGTATGVTGTGSAYFIMDRSKVKVGFFQRPDHFPLPPNGDSQRGFVLAEWGMKLLHPKALGVGYNVTDAPYA
jgi:hypothetical protein